MKNGKIYPAVFYNHLINYSRFVYYKRDFLLTISDD